MPGKPNRTGYRALSTKWSSGNLQYVDSNGNVIATWDATNRKLTLPSGAVLDLTGATGTLSLAAGEIATADLAANAVDATKLALYADSGLTPGPEVVLQFTVADHATQNVDFVIASKMVVDDVLVVSTSAQGANANTVQLDNGITGSHITDAMSLNGKIDGDVVRCASLFDANLTIAAGGTLRVIQTKVGGTMSFIAKVRGHLSA